MRPARLAACAGVAVLPMSLLAACGGDSGDKSAKAAGGTTAIRATDTACELARKEFTAGTTTFNVSNAGTKVTEVYVYAAGDKIAGEKENIGPGTSTELTVQLAAGKYQVACKPGMVGNGIRQEITVTGTAAQAPDTRSAKAVTDYQAYVVAQVDDTIAKTRRFAEAVKKGDVAEAKSLYGPSRVGWERIEPVAESFGDLDPKVDAREADVKPGTEWTGWHRLEKALWKDGSVKGRERYADQLLTDLGTLKSRVGSATLDPPITPVSMANGAKELLDEVATGKVTGEEEAYSHTDLLDFKANVDGAHEVFELLEPVVLQKDADLAKSIDEEFDKVQALLKKYEKGDGYVSYDTVGQADRKQLSDAVNALGEPLSRLAKAVS